MEKKVRDPDFWVMSIIATAFLANCLWNWAYNHPFLYWQLRAPVWQVYQSMGLPALIAILCAAGWSLYRRDAKHALLCVCLFVGINNLPQIADSFLRQGGSCV